MKWKHVIIAVIIAMIIFAPVDASRIIHGLVTFFTTLWGGFHLH